MRTPGFILARYRNYECFYVVRVNVTEQKIRLMDTGAKSIWQFGDADDDKIQFFKGRQCIALMALFSLVFLQAGL